MGLFDGCILASDIDGTLLTDGRIPNINLEKIEWFKSEGGIFTLSTGRTVNATRYSYDLSKANAPVITFHGGAIYDYKNNMFIYHKTLPFISRYFMKEIMNEFPTVGVEVHSGLKLYDIRPNKVTYHHVEYESLVFDKIPDNLEQEQWTKVLFGVEEEEELKRLDEFCKKFEGKGCRFMITHNKENARYFEMVPEEINKGQALLFLKKYFNCHTAYGIGDYFNDTELILKADFSAVTSGAPVELKNIADYVTCSCEDGAVADFIDRISLVKGS